MGYLFTSESVSEGHPDKVADQISDAVLDKLLAYDPSSKVACETLVTTGQVVLAGEVKTKAYVDLQLIAREVIKKIGYTKGEYMFESNSCGVLSAIHEQSPDINRGVERQDPMEQGAGDQGMMFGYATNETENYMPLSLDLAHRILQVLADIRREGKVMTYLRPDAKSQVTIEYDDNGAPVRIDTIVVSTQHDDFIQPEDDQTIPFHFNPPFVPLRLSKNPVSRMPLAFLLRGARHASHDIFFCTPLQSAGGSVGICLTESNVFPILL